jgi:3-keto-5-aminohexanoate cleavage enzyme
MVDPLSGDSRPSAGPEQQTEEQKRRTIERTVQEICDARDAGATISHHHGVRMPHPKGQGYTLDEEATAETILAVRRKSDVIIQMGGPSAVLLQTEEGQQFLDRLWKKAKVEQVSTHTNQMEFAARGIARIITRDQLERAVRFCLQQCVQPEFEVWQIGATWNLRQVLEKVGAKPPFWVNLLHAADGAVWSPATLEETLHRAAYLPKGAQWHADAYTLPRGQLTPEEHTRFLTQVIAVGGNVRIGKEDRPNLATGQPAKSNAELVELIVWIARKLGREIATPDQARKMLGLKGH